MAECLFSTDPLTVDFDKTDLMKVLSDIENIMDSEEYDLFIF